MKIAIVSDAIYPYNKGGKEKHIYEVSTRLVKEGHTVDIYTMKWWVGRNVKTTDGVTIHAISPYYPLYAGKRRSIKQAIIFSLNCFKLLRENFDIIDVDHMPHLVIFPIKLVCLIKKKKMTATWNEVWGKDYWKKYLGVAGEVAFFIEKLSVQLPTKIISISDLTTKRLKEEFNRTDNVYTINLGVNFKNITSITPSSHKSDIVFVGRLLSHKNVPLLIQAISIIKKQKSVIKCLIIGEGPEKARLTKLVDDLDLTKSIQFIDFIPNENDLYALMKASKVFAFPSLREGFGIVAAEANACGLPVVTVKHKDNAAVMLINENNGMVVANDAPEFADAILRYLNNVYNKEFFKTISKKFDWDFISNRTEEVYLS